VHFERRFSFFGRRFSFCFTCLKQLSLPVKDSACISRAFYGLITFYLIDVQTLNECIHRQTRSLMMPPAKKRPRKTLKEAGRAQFRATLDRNFVRLMKALMRKYEQRRSVLASSLIAQLKTDKKLSEEMSEFYKKTWLDIEPRTIDTAALFNWPIETDDALRKLSWSIIGTGNKSELLRVIIAFFAKQNRIPLSAQE
jgi:hypothetical protein